VLKHVSNRAFSRRAILALAFSGLGLACSPAAAATATWSTQALPGRRPPP